MIKLVVCSVLRVTCRVSRDRIRQHIKLGRVFERRVIQHEYQPSTDHAPSSTYCNLVGVADYEEMVMIPTGKCWLVIGKRGVGCLDKGFGSDVQRGHPPLLPPSTTRSSAFPSR